MQVTAGGVTSPRGFRAAGVYAGIKAAGRGLDVAVVASEAPCTAAAMFTRNLVKAAPVLWSQRLLALGKPVRAVVANSGNANACTGQRGLEDAVHMGEAVAEALGVGADEVLVASTGVIGVPLPMERLTRGIADACQQLSVSPEAGAAAAEAIRTTDTFAKTGAVTVELDGCRVTLGGMAKGSGMIHPNMATMLAFITTDAAISRECLEAALRESVIDSYNQITVDGDTSTNDTVVVLANGLAGNPQICGRGPAYERFKEALHELNVHLAKQIARDGEGATKLLEVSVRGARDTEGARRLARAVVASNLVKAAMFGADANWGRVLAALGNAGVAFQPEHVRIQFVSAAGRVHVMEDGEPLPFDEDVARRVLSEPEILVHVDLGDGAAEARAWGCDLTYEYVRINGEYRS
ncbi:MAG: bifunctional glutamate N-acetyltransferase/amino-acid acetyltransferase ArgJ [Alicyclobacillus sp.]|nr:bifunctional glutamate N-acetyltransferase/amino-acid acetyltransferase ArgJ [Alicyclobacillus sp.]